MTKGKPLTSEEISAIVDGFDPIDAEEMEIIASLIPSQRILRMLEKVETIRSDLRDKLMQDFPELSLSEINMKVLRSLTPVRLGKSFTEPAYFEYFGQFTVQSGTLRSRSLNSRKLDEVDWFISPQDFSPPDRVQRFPSK